MLCASYFIKPNRKSKLIFILAEKAHTCSPPYSYNAELNLCWRLETEKRANWLKAGWQCGTEGGHLIILDTPAKVSYIQHALIMGMLIINFKI